MCVCVCLVCFGPVALVGIGGELGGFCGGGRLHHDGLTAIWGEITQCVINSVLSSDKSLITSSHNPLTK